MECELSNQVFSIRPKFPVLEISEPDEFTYFIYAMKISISNETCKKWLKRKNFVRKFKKGDMIAMITALFHKYVSIDKINFIYRYMRKFCYLSHIFMHDGKYGPYMYFEIGGEWKVNQFPSIQGLKMYNPVEVKKNLYLLEELDGYRFSVLADKLIATSQHLN